MSSGRTTGRAARGAAGRASRALAELARRGIAVDSFSLGQPSLDEVFLALTGHPAEADAPTSDLEELSS